MNKCDICIWLLEKRMVDLAFYSFSQVFQDNEGTDELTEMNIGNESYARTVTPYKTNIITTLENSSKIHSLPWIIMCK